MGRTCMGSRERPIVSLRVFHILSVDARVWASRPRIASCVQ